MSILVYTEQLSATEFASDELPAQAVMIRSPLGHAGTFETLSTVEDNTSSWTCRILGLGGGQALIGQIGPLAVSAAAFTPFHVVMRTNDAGETWASVVPTTIFHHDVQADFWRVAELLDFDNDTILAMGNYSDDDLATTFAFLKSTDGGATFAKHAVSEFGAAETGLSLGGGVGLVGRSNGEVWKTSDSGDSWSNVTPPAPSGTSPSIKQIIRMTTGRVVALGDRTLSAVRRPYLAWSDNDGASWTTVNDPVPALDGNTHNTSSAVALAGGYAMLAVTGNPATNDFRPYWMSADGETFAIAGTFNDSFTTNSTGATPQMAVADDGAVLAALNGLGSSLTDTALEVWRGVRDGDTHAWNLVYARNFEPTFPACLKSFIANIGEPEGEPSAPPAEPEEFPTAPQEVRVIAEYIY